jgi:hypothetical protein
VESKYKEPGNIPGLDPPSSKRKNTKIKTSKPIGKLFPGFEETEEKSPIGQSSGKTDSRLGEVAGVNRFQEATTEISSENGKISVKKNTGEQDKLNGEVSFSGTVLSNNRMAVDQVVRDYFMKQSGRDVCSSKDSLKTHSATKGKKKNEVVLVGTLKEARHLVSKKTGNPFYMAQIILPVDAYPVTVFIWEDKWPEIEKMFKENKNKVVAIKGALSGEKDGWNYSVSLDEIYVPEPVKTNVLGLQTKER